MKSGLEIDIEKIKDDYGTVRRFCRIVEINYSTFYVVKAGNGKSASVVNKLKELGYLKAS